MTFDMLRSPVQFLRRVLPELPQEGMLRDYEAWWEVEGKQISEATDRAGTPWLRKIGRASCRERV